MLSVLFNGKEMHMKAPIVEMCHSGFVCDVITSYTTLNSNPEKLQHIYQEANRACMLENVCVVLSVLHCSMFQTSAKNKVFTTAQDGAVISCAGMLPQ